MSVRDETTFQPLSTISVFSEITPDYQQQIITQTTHLSIRAGQTLIKEGEAGIMTMHTKYLHLGDLLDLI